MVGTEKENPDEEDDTGAVGAKLKGTAEEDAAGAEEVEETDVRGMFGNAVGAEGTEAAGLAGWVAKEPMQIKKKKKVRKSLVVDLSTS